MENKKTLEERLDILLAHQSVSSPEELYTLILTEFDSELMNSIELVALVNVFDKKLHNIIDMEGFLKFMQSQNNNSADNG